MCFHMCLICCSLLRRGHGAEGGDHPQRELAQPGGGGAGGDDCVPGKTHTHTGNTRENTAEKNCSLFCVCSAITNSLECEL